MMTNSNLIVTDSWQDGDIEFISVIFEGERLVVSNKKSFNTHVVTDGCGNILLEYLMNERRARKLFNDAKKIVESGKMEKGA